MLRVLICSLFVHYVPYLIRVPTKSTIPVEIAVNWGKESGEKVSRNGCANMPPGHACLNVEVAEEFSFQFMDTNKQRNVTSINSNLKSYKIIDSCWYLVA